MHYYGTLKSLLEMTYLQNYFRFLKHPPNPSLGMSHCQVHVNFENTRLITCNNSQDLVHQAAKIANIQMMSLNY